MDFLSDLAWWMFQRREKAIDFRLYEKFVEETYPALAGEDEQQVFELDLLTTGFFSLSGDILHFAVPAFFDYLVALRFARAEFRDSPTRPPTMEQAKILLVLCEQGYLNAAAWQSEKATEWLRRMGIELTTEQLRQTSVSVRPVGILFKHPKGAPARECWERDPHGHLVSRLYDEDDPTGYMWDVVNAPENYNIRGAVYFGLFNPKRPAGDSIVGLLIANEYGIHMRPAMLLVDAFGEWYESLDGRPVVTAIYENQEADPASIMQMAMLPVPRGEVLYFRYERCTHEEFEEFLSRFAERAPEGSDGDWVTDFEKAY